MSSETKKPIIKKKDLATAKIYKSFHDAFADVSKNLDRQHQVSLAKVKRGRGR